MDLPSTNDTAGHQQAIDEPSAGSETYTARYPNGSAAFDSAASSAVESSVGKNQHRITQTKVNGTDLNSDPNHKCTENDERDTDATVKGDSANNTNASFKTWQDGNFVETSEDGSELKDDPNDNSRKDNLMSTGDIIHGEKNGSEHASSTDTKDEKKNIFSERRIAKRFRVSTTNRRHLNKIFKVNRIFFGAVEGAIPGNVELWKIIYDDGDVDVFSRPQLIAALNYYDANKKFDTDNFCKKQSSLSQLDNGEEEEKNKINTASTKRRGRMTNAKASPPKKAKNRKTKAAKPEPVPVWEGIPDEEIEGGWPKGWVKKLYSRKAGATKGHTDKYYYSPKQKIKLRSLVQVRKFMKALKEANGDEITAKENMGKIS